MHKLKTLAPKMISLWLTWVGACKAHRRPSDPGNDPRLEDLGFPELVNSKTAEKCRDGLSFESHICSFVKT